IPIVGPVTLAFFDDFGLDVNLQSSQLRESVLGNDAITSPTYGCPAISNGECVGGVQGQVGVPAFAGLNLNTVHGTNWVPRMSTGAELQVVLPVVNAPLRLYYAYNPLRLYEQIPQQLALPNAQFTALFPSDNVVIPGGGAPGAGAYSAQQALQYYGANYLLREPRKTFRLTVSTTF
ncbi:MAG TPA: hypothetical protein VNU94_07105, partial [Acidobacteriaceae bacterium]|nr:hypothetical protein [Acidobacteriaceae bacterium]